LQTPEQIAAWVAERKKRWPTKERVEEKARSFLLSQSSTLVPLQFLKLTSNSPSFFLHQSKAREDAIARGEFDPSSSSSSRRGARGGGRGGARGSTRGGRGGSRGGGESSSYGSRGGEPPSKKGRWGAGAGAEEDQGWKSKRGKPAPVPGGNPIEDFDSDPLSSSSGDDDSSDSDSDSDDSGSDIDPVKDAVSSRLPPTATTRPLVDGGEDIQVEEEEIEMGGDREGGGERSGGRTCTYFLAPQGCKMGDRCRFVHDESLRPAAPVRSKPLSSFFLFPVFFSLPQLSLLKLLSVFPSSPSLSHRSSHQPVSLLPLVLLPLPPNPPTPDPISSWACWKRTSSIRLLI